MEAESGNITGQCIENNDQNNSSTDQVITDSTYPQNDNVSVYPHYETQESSSEVLVNNEMSSYNTQEYNVETNVSYPENFEAGTIDSEETKEVIENEVSEQPQINEIESIPMETSQNVENENVENDYVSEYKEEEINTENTLNESNSQDSNVIVEEPVENTQNADEPVSQKIEESVTDVTVEEIDNPSLPEYAEVMDTQESSHIVVSEVEDNNAMSFESARVEESSYEIEESVKVEEPHEDIDNTVKVDEKIKKSSFVHIGEHANLSEGDLLIQEVPSIQTVHLDQPQEERLVTDKDENAQIIQIENNTVQENKPSIVSETVIFQSADGSHQMGAQRITIIESSDSIDFSSHEAIIEEVGVDQSFSEEDLNSTVNESYVHDDSMSQDSSVSEEVIIIQEVDSEENPDDPSVTEAQKSDQSEPKPKSRKGRKSTFDIPMHVLGHDINKPLEPVVNGRAIPKPRLGVKVPYRNLTSQIVSKAEIEKEIMERGRLKMELNKDQTFARSLTQRLVKKIAPPSESKEPTILDIIEHKEQKQKAKDEQKSKIKEEKKLAPVTTTVSEQTSIQNDSDLLAILEGDGDEGDMPVVQKEPSNSPQVDESNLKALEREIALQQLSELPHQTPRQRIFRGKTSKPVTPPGNQLKEKPSTPVTNSQQNISKEKNKENSTHSSTPHPKKDRVEASPRKQHVEASPKKQHAEANPKKQPIEIEPQVKVNMVLKTYSRKRKISEPQDPLKDYPPPKKPVYDSPDDTETKESKEPAVMKKEPVDINLQPPSPVYVTKSSRVIKKKVIWDPDEIPVRSPKSTPKPATESKTTVQKTSPAVKTVKTERTPSSEKVAEKKVVEKKTQERKIEKPQSEKRAEKTTPPKKSSSPKSNSGSKPKKLRSEIDRLLMDEGAVKMLYELNNTDETAPKKKKEFYSVERAQKEIIKKANLLKNELEQTTTNDSQISLRKKEAMIIVSVPSPPRSGPILERKMSKDSTRSSVHTPPPSPFQHSQSSMLIRRRSSSSLSSSDDTEVEFKPREARRKSDTPKLKKSKKSEENEVEESSKSGQTPKKQMRATVLEVKLNQYKAFTVKKTGRHVSIDLNYIDEKCYFTLQVLEELCIILKKFSKDKECNVLTITSSSKAFCLGLDYPSLVEEEEEMRQELAINLSDKVKDFLLCLLHFPKVLVACIQGDCMGLGVTMLPLFDIVIASDSATFTTPHSKLGCIGEAAFLLSYPNLVSHLQASEMVFTGQKVTADEAFRRGLISKLCWPEKYKETLKTLVGSVAKASKQSLEASKKQMRIHKIKEIESAINSERKIWIEHWTSPECQEKFSQIGNKEA